MAKIKTAAEAARMVPDGATVAVNSSSGLLCPDAVLKALGARFLEEAAPSSLTTVHPIAAGDMFGTPGVDHLAHPGMIRRIIGGSYPSGPTNAEPPRIWQRILAEEVAAWTCLRALSSTCCAKVRPCARACSPRSAWTPSSIPRWKAAR